jgi:hypothetical protein
MHRRWAGETDLYVSFPRPLARLGVNCLDTTPDPTGRWPILKSCG